MLGLIWFQWCLGHLADDDLVQLLVRCRSALTEPKGLICIKENVSSSCIFDQTDSSVTR